MTYKADKFISTIVILTLLPFSTLSNAAEEHIRLEHADHLTFDSEIQPDAQVLMGNVRFSHSGAVMTCDSAHFYQQNDNFDAYSNIRMTQGDSILIVGDMLHYNGETKHARLKGNVIMTNRTTQLTADSLDYDINTNTGYYDTGGQLRDEENTLTSIWGEYNTKSKIAKFRNDVRLTGKDAAIQTDNLNYNTRSKIAEVEGRSIMVYDNGKMSAYTEKGWYDTNKEKGELNSKANKIDRNDGKHITGELIKFDRKTGEAWAMRNATIWDDSAKASINGAFIYYRDGDARQEGKQKTNVTITPSGPAKGMGRGDFAIGYKRAVCKLSNGKDTLYASADTLKMIQNEIDTTQRTAWAIGDVRIFKSDGQARCDSIIFHSVDSTAIFKGNPIVWSDSIQIRGEWMEVQIGEDKRPKTFKVMGWAAGAMDDALGKKNQIEGKKMTGYMKNGKIDRIVVNGNAESIYWARDDEDSIVGMNKGASSQQTLYIKDSKMDRIVMSPNGSGTLYPEDKVPEDEDMLKKFKWMPEKRPRSPQDIKPGDLYEASLITELETGIKSNEDKQKSSKRKKRK